MAESMDPKGLPEDDKYTIRPAADPDQAPVDEPKSVVGTAFVIVVTEAGAASATNDLTVIDKLELTRSAGLDEMHRAVLEVDRDLTIARTAQETVALMSMQAQLMAEQQQEQAIRQQVLQQGAKGPNLGPRRR